MASDSIVDITVVTSFVLRNMCCLAGSAVTIPMSAFWAFWSGWDFLGLSCIPPLFSKFGLRYISLLRS